MTLSQRQVFSVQSLGVGMACFLLSDLAVFGRTSVSPAMEDNCLSQHWPPFKSDSPLRLGEICSVISYDALAEKQKPLIIFICNH